MAREAASGTTGEELRGVPRQEASRRTGQLKIFLGYASGVGKSFRMLDEARRRRERGQDVVVGAVQPKVPLEVEAVLAKLEVVPLQTLWGQPVMDVDALLRRRPAVCIIDGLAYDNPPGARHATRWQDAEELLCAGTKVIGSVNIQYIEELRQEVEAITSLAGPEGGLIFGTSSGLFAGMNAESIRAVYPLR